MCLQTKMMPGVHPHIQRRGRGPGVQPNEQVRLPWGEHQSPCRLVHRGQPVHTQRMVQLPEVHPRTVRPTERSSGAQSPMLRAEILETMLYGYVTWSPRACHYDTLSRAHHRFLVRFIGWRKDNRADHLICYLGTLIKTRSESIQVTLRRRRILFAGYVARMEDTRLPKCVMFGELAGSASCVGGQEKEWMGCFLDDLRAFGINAHQGTTAVQDEGK